MLDGVLQQRFIGQFPGFSLLLPILPLECKRFLPGIRASTLLLRTPLIKVSRDRVPVSWTALPFFSIVIVRLFVRTEWFREGLSLERPGMGRSFPGFFLRPADQQIHLLLQLKQLLLHGLQQGNKIGIGLIRHCRCVSAYFFCHLTGLPFNHGFGILNMGEGNYRGCFVFPCAFTLGWKAR